VPEALAKVAGGDVHASAKTYDTPVHGTGGSRYVNLGWLSDGARHVQWVEGREPRATGATRWQGRRIPLYEVGVSEEARDEMGLEVGDERILGESDFAAVRVVGVFRATDPGDPFWSHHNDVLHVAEVQPPGRIETEKYATTLIADTGLVPLSGADRNLIYQWVLPVDPGRPEARETDALE